MTAPAEEKWCMQSISELRILELGNTPKIMDGHVHSVWIWSLLPNRHQMPASLPRIRRYWGLGSGQWRACVPPTGVGDKSGGSRIASYRPLLIPGINPICAKMGFSVISDRVYSVVALVQSAGMNSLP